MRRRFRLAALGGGLALLGLLFLQPVRAEDSAAATPPAKAPLPAYAVEGFRSARFGMTEAEVRKAIRADFPDDRREPVQSSTNPVEHTRILAIAVPHLLPDTEVARLTYIFGYEHHRLIQVNVLWEAPKRGKAPDSLRAPGEALRNYFLGYAFRPDGLVHDLALRDGSTLLFQGVDDKGRMISLTSGSAVIAAAGKMSAPLPAQWFLRLSYVANPGAPDIYHLKPGTF